MAAPPLEALPCELVEHLKWLCLRAAESGAHVAKGRLPAAADAALAGLLHARAVCSAESLECPGLREETRLLLARAAWLALPALWHAESREQYQSLRSELMEAPDLQPGLRQRVCRLLEAGAEMISQLWLRRTSDDGIAEWERLSQLVWASRQCYWRRPCWRGVNLGGWLLLEPGPSYELWDKIGARRTGERERAADAEAAAAAPPASAAAQVDGLAAAVVAGEGAAHEGGEWPPGGGGAGRGEDTVTAARAEDQGSPGEDAVVGAEEQEAEEEQEQEDGGCEEGDGEDGGEEEEAEVDEEVAVEGAAEGGGEAAEGGGEEEAEEEEDIWDEYALCLRLGAKRRRVIERHRRRWLNADDFTWLKERGFNAVRVPFGYWVVTGPTRNDPFVGPALQHLDTVVALAEQFDFQVVLDLHGNPGGESGEAPCGRKRANWSERCWRRKEALEVLEQVARRYAGRRCIAGLQVCNEPAGSCNMSGLCTWYERAVQRIRSAGMSAGDVAVILPVYWYDRLEEFLRVWLPRGNFLRYENVALDFHFYQCFGGGWELLDHQEHLRVVQRHGAILRSLPGAVVGEWSLARPPHVLATDQMEAEFAQAQVEAYAAASHGWFFWTYSDQADHWDLDTCFERGWLRQLDAPPEESPRGPAPGPAPRCYGQEEFSQLPKRPRLSAEDVQSRRELSAQAAALAAATGRPVTEAAAVLLACDGDGEAAAARLLAAAAAHRLAEALACSKEEAEEALRACGGNEGRAACHLLDAPRRGEKRPLGA